MELMQFLERRRDVEVYVPIKNSEIQTEKMLGCGGLATVYRAKYRDKVVAAKVV